LLPSSSQRLITDNYDDNSAQRKQHGDARVARKCNKARDLGYLPKLHCHHLSVRLDDHPLEHPATTREETQTALAPDRLVISDYNCTRDCCSECFVGRIMVGIVRVWIYTDVLFYRLQYLNAKSLMRFVNAHRLPKRKSHRQCLNTIAFACFAPIQALDRLRISRFGHFLVRSGLIRDRSEAQCEDERTFAAERDVQREARAQATMEDANLEWTMGMAFFALSGGCAYRNRDGGYRILDRYLIVDLVRNEPLSLLPVQRLVLQDPGKADAIAKLIACIQAFWFCSQCIARLGANRAVSLLEVNTFAHCISTLLIYICWWNKPYNAEVHAAITSPWLDLQFLNHQLHLCDNPAIIHRTDQYSLHDLSHITGSIVDINEKVLLRIVEWTTETGINHTEYRKLLPSAPGTDSRLRVKIPDTGLYLTADVPDAFIDADICLLECDLDAWQRFWHMWTDLDCPLAKDPPELSTPGLGLSTHEIYDLDMNLILLATQGHVNFVTALIITLTSVVYGGLHTLAWQYSFSSKYERLLWQISSVVTSSSGLGLFAFSMSRMFNHPWMRGARSPFHNTMCFGIKWIAYTMILLNIASRAFLFVESFVALPNSPNSTYEIPSWTSYIPHL
jgi:hypothetical protein